MSASIGSEIRKYKDEILEDVIRTVNIKSFRSAPLQGMPFGEGPAQALQFCLNLAKGFGLTVKNVGNRAGHVEYGMGDELVGILAHVDVVPAGEGWTVPPFGDTVKDGRIYGRGTMDDKGPAIAAIYCLKTLKDLNIVPKRRIRVILGASEECGMEDMEYYFAHEEMPDLAFTPDGDYPICNMEKGILHLTLKGDCGANGSVLSFTAGNAPNMVPFTAEASVRCTPEESAQIEKAVADYDAQGIRFALLPSAQGGLTIRCYGRAAHASTPEQGVNAAAYLIRLLSGVYGTGLLRFLNEVIGTEFDGKTASVACSDRSGSLTLNLGVVNTGSKSAEAVVDIRYPVTVKSAGIVDTLSKKAAAYGVDLSVDSDSEPLVVDENSPLIKKLRSAYKTVMQKEAALYSTGGGSYARSLQNRGVAFGAGIKPLSYYNIHAADEFLEIEDFMKHCEICLQAIYELSCK